MLCITAGPWWLMPWSWADTLPATARDWVWAVLDRGTPVGSSPRTGQGTEGPVDRRSPEMVLWDQHQCSEGMQQTGRLCLQAYIGSQWQQKLKRKELSVLHRALIPTSSNITSLACCPCAPVCASAHCAHHRGPHHSHAWLGWLPDMGPKAALQAFLWPHRSLGNIKDPNISPVVMSKDYIYRPFQFFIFSHIPVQLLLKRDGHNHASLLFLTFLPTLCH